MKKACSGNVCDRRANLTSSVDDIHTEGIHCISTKNRQCKENGCQKCYQKTLLHLISSPNFPIQIIVSIQSSIRMKRHSLGLKWQVRQFLHVEILVLLNRFVCFCCVCLVFFLLSPQPKGTNAPMSVIPHIFYQNNYYPSMEQWITCQQEGIKPWVPRNWNGIKDGGSDQLSKTFT